VIDLVRKLGITSPIDPVPSICLGTPDVSVFEMVGAYSTFANKGVWTEPVYITRIEDKKGNVLQEFIPKRVEAMNEETAYLMINLLQGVVQYGTGASLRGSRYKLYQPMAGKTGTTQEHSDGWYMGITPELVAGVWVGNEDRSAHFRSLEFGQGARLALPIWAYFMMKVYGDKSLKVYQGDFERPKDKLSVEIDCKKYKDPAVNDNPFLQEGF
jgi:penicillin-binding protein 1A